MSEVEVSPYGYSPRPIYVPRTGDEPQQARSEEWRDVDFPDAFRESGQPVGPELVRGLLEAAQTPEGAAMLRKLLRIDRGEPRTFVYEQVVGFETDASGNGFAPVFDVPQGARAYLTRCIVEVAGQAPNSAVVAATWAGVFETGGGTAGQGVTTATYGPGQLRDFAPRNSSSGLFFPIDLVDVNKDNAWGYRAGSRVAVVLAGAAGIANKAATVAAKFLVEYDQSVTAT